ncbi:MAG: ABC transporter ATP-binding protein [Myxococcales bacterium]|nr:ABC transporter ATP-binding protein [Myxococcales bacterium]HIK84352.1 ABC transporter ATP-binding protein [Myxococcales bacterium]
MIVARNLTQRYSRAASESGDGGNSVLTVLDSVDLDVAEGEVVVILGPSGSGKTTLLGLMAGLDRPSEGELRLAGVDLGSLDEDARAAMRAERIGFIFQSFHLIATLTALENVLVPLELLSSSVSGASGRSGRRQRRADAEETARALLDRVGLAGRLGHYPAQLSGGEQQRVGIARAFANQPAVLFADEPTGNLDRETGQEIVNLLFELNQQRGTTLVIVTHDLELSRRADRIIHLAGGRIERIEKVGRIG